MCFSYPLSGQAFLNSILNYLGLRSSCLFQLYKSSDWCNLYSFRSCLQAGQFFFPLHLFFKNILPNAANSNEHTTFCFPIFPLSYKFITWPVFQVNCRQQFCEMFHHDIPWIAIFLSSENSFLAACHLSLKYFRFSLWQHLTLDNNFYLKWGWSRFCCSDNPKFSVAQNNKNWASLVTQWLRVCLPMQGTWVRALVWEDPTCRGATRPMCHKYWACASGACAPQQERPRQWEACAPWWRVALLATTRESPRTATKTQHRQK